MAGQVAAPSCASNLHSVDDQRSWRAALLQTPSKSIASRGHHPFQEKKQKYWNIFVIMLLEYIKFKEHDYPTLLQRVNHSVERTEQKEQKEGKYTPRLSSPVPWTRF